MPVRSTQRSSSTLCPSLILSTLLMGSAGAAGPAAAAEHADATPCDIPQAHQFDFWVGDWQVFDAKTGQLVAFDRVEKHTQGCIVQQNLTMLTDLYRRPDVSYRMTGIGVNRFDGERWLELWADNQWGAIALSGMPEGGKAMVLTSIIPSRGRDLRLVWEKQADGSVRALQYVAPTGSGKWQLYGDLIYRPNR